MSVGTHALIDLVFSWSINDVLNNNLYKDKVRTIPCVFSSEAEYLKSFIGPLIEETHADMLASFTTLSDPLCLEIESIKKARDYNPPKDFLYEIDLKREVKDHRGNTVYEPEAGDLIAISSLRPQCVSDLDRPERPYLVAYVKRVRESNDNYELLVLSSKPVMGEDDKEEDNVGALFAVNLTNLTTNIRIWNSLRSDAELANRRIIRNVLLTNFVDVENCAECNLREKYGSIPLNVQARLCNSDLNDSQRDAVLSCIEARECHHLNSVKIIWGPPGTGKTKTVGFLLHLLLMMQCRTLTCTPTNTACVQVTKRLVEKVKDTAECNTYGLGDIVLLGNRKRMKIDDFDELHDVFLEHRADALNNCLHPRNGWKDSLESMIGLLKEPEKRYQSYVEAIKGKSHENNGDDDKENCVTTFENEDIKRNHEKGGADDKSEKNKKKWKLVIDQMIKDNRKKHRPKENGGTGEKILVTPLTFEKFVKKRFHSLGERLYFFATILCTHLPTSVISLEVVKNMFLAIEFLESLQTFLYDVPDEDFREAFSQGSLFTNFTVARLKSLHHLESLPFTFTVPWSPDRRLIREFCLEKACLIFCTVSGSAKLHIIDMAPLELLVIDEAAQLKECESTIPLQLPGLRHAILVGDERQLPAMVRSQISEAAQFGRSLYERLAFLEHKKHLLNVQYRMHPSISLFPNREFYCNHILDGRNVGDKSYKKHYLQGVMYSPYSFINVSYGKEEYDDKRSRKNIVEVAVVAEIIASLHRVSLNTKKKVRVGVISPYKAQVRAISDKIARYTTDVHGNFCVNVRTVDGFQGGEEDVIIISTVRCNGIGSISFLASRQRANVALTRARYCLWIVGSGSTLSNSNTFWKRLVADAKDRGCFHDAAEDNNLARTIIVSLVEDNRVSALHNVEPLLFKNARWKVNIAEAFWWSLTRLRNNVLCKKVLDLLERLSKGSNQLDKRSDQVVRCGPSSQIVDYYKINSQQYLVCTVDIIKENSHYIQILKVWDILPEYDIPNLSNRLHTLYGSYSEDRMRRCKYKCYDGDVLVPMRWPVDSSNTESNTNQLSSKLLSSVSLKNNSDTSTTQRRESLILMKEREQEQERASHPKIDSAQLVTKSRDSFSPSRELATPSTTNMNTVDQQILPLNHSHGDPDPIEELSELFALLTLKG